MRFLRSVYSRAHAFLLHSSYTPTISLSPLRLRRLSSRVSDLLSDQNEASVNRSYFLSRPGHFGNEVVKVLGGGLAPGSLILIGGEHGIGKSTLLLQIAYTISKGSEPAPAPVLYVSGEESFETLRTRADRMSIPTDELHLFSSTDLQDILTKAHRLSPRALIIDSIQSVCLEEVTGCAGGLTQVNECTSALLRFAKKSNVLVFLVGHVTKTDDIAGPHVLEHIVDVVLYMEGVQHSNATRGKLGDDEASTAV